MKPGSPSGGGSPTLVWGFSRRYCQNVCLQREERQQSQGIQETHQPPQVQACMDHITGSTTHLRDLAVLVFWWLEAPSFIGWCFTDCTSLHPPVQDIAQTSNYSSCSLPKPFLFYQHHSGEPTACCMTAHTAVQGDQTTSSVPRVNHQECLRGWYTPGKRPAVNGISAALLTASSLLFFDYREAVDQR